MKSVKLSACEAELVIIALEKLKKTLLDENYSSSRHVKESSIVWINNTENKFKGMYKDHEWSFFNRLYYEYRRLCNL